MVLGSLQSCIVRTAHGLAQPIWLWPYIVMAYMVMAYIGIAYIGMVYIVMAHGLAQHVYPMQPTWPV